MAGSETPIDNQDTSPASLAEALPHGGTEYPHSHHVKRKHVGLTLAILLAVSFLSLAWRDTIEHFIWAAIAGTLPALFWLWFWLHEDRIHPEPRRIIFKTFFFGALAVPIAIIAETVTYTIVSSLFEYQVGGDLSLEKFPPQFIFLFFFLWAIVEEYAKYRAALRGGLSSKFFDEPIDTPIYFISAAIGFATFENILFVWETILSDGLLHGLFVSDMRFLGASLLHIVASGLVGLFAGFGWYRSERTRKMLFLLGMSTAILLHTLFNYFIMVTRGNNTFTVFLLLWLSAVLVFLLFEKIKRLKS